MVHVADVSPAVLHLPGDVTIDTADLAASQRKAVWEKAEPVLSAFEVTSKQVDLEGYPADALVDYCDQTKADLLVLGTRGRGRLSSTFLGSTSLRALERAHCDVLIAKG